MLFVVQELYRIQDNEYSVIMLLEQDVDRQAQAVDRRKQSTGDRGQSSQTGSLTTKSKCPRRIMKLSLVLEGDD